MDYLKDKFKDIGKVKNLKKHGETDTNYVKYTFEVDVEVSNTEIKKMFGSNVYKNVKISNET